MNICFDRVIFFLYVKDLEFWNNFRVEIPKE